MPIGQAQTRNIKAAIHDLEAATRHGEWPRLDGVLHGPAARALDVVLKAVEAELTPRFGSETWDVIQDLRRGHPRDEVPGSKAVRLLGAVYERIASALDKAHSSYAVWTVERGERLVGKLASARRSGRRDLLSAVVGRAKRVRQELPHVLGEADEQTREDIITLMGLLDAERLRAEARLSDERPPQGSRLVHVTESPDYAVPQRRHERN